MSEPEVRQYTAVAIGGQALLIEGSPGSGKSSLALALIDRGATLIGDDAIALEINAGRLKALPPPNTAGLIEVRNVGIVEMPTTAASVSLILELTPDAPRYLEQANTEEVMGIDIPKLKFAFGQPTDTLRAELALKLHGLP